MTPQRPILGILAALALTAPAMAQTVAVAGADEAVSTAAHRVDAKTAAEAEKLQAAQAEAAAKAPPPKPLTTDEQIAAFLATSPAVGLEDGARGITRLDDGEREPRKIHGSAGVTVGTGGYRSAYVSTLIPIGETSTLGVAYSQTDHGNNAVFRPYDEFGYDGGYGGGYAGAYGRGWDHDGLNLGRPGRWSRGGKSQSLAVSLAVGSDRQRPPEGCAPAFRADGRYVEPLWATQMRGDQNPCALGESR
jgi:hypothetical protein